MRPSSADKRLVISEDVQEFSFEKVGREKKRAIRCLLMLTQLLWIHVLFNAFSNGKAFGESEKNLA